MADKKKKMTRKGIIKSAQASMNRNSFADLFWDDLTPEDKEEAIKIIRAALNYGAVGDTPRLSDRTAYRGEAGYGWGPKGEAILTAVPRQSGKLAGADRSQGDLMRAQGLTPLF